MDSRGTRVCVCARLRFSAPAWPRCGHRDHGGTASTPGFQKGRHFKKGRHKANILEYSLFIDKKIALPTPTHTPVQNIPAVLRELGGHTRVSPVRV